MRGELCTWLHTQERRHSSLLAILGHELPLNSGMLLAVAGGMVTGAVLEGRREAHG